MKKIFITATNTNIGKTHTTIMIAKLLNKLGYKVGVFKPIETGVIDIPTDGAKLLKASFNKDLTLNDVVPLQFSLPASPYVAKGNAKIDFQKIKQSYHDIAQNSDIVLVEGAGGVLTPVEKDFFMIDFVDMLGIDKTILVSPNTLGSINDTLLSQNLLQQKKINYTWLVNNYPEDKKTYEKITLPFFGSVTYVDEINQKWVEEELLN